LLINSLVAETCIPLTGARKRGAPTGHVGNATLVAQKPAVTQRSAQESPRPSAASSAILGKPAVVLATFALLSQSCGALFTQTLAALASTVHVLLDQSIRVVPMTLCASGIKWRTTLLCLSALLLVARADGSAHALEKRWEPVEVPPQPPSLCEANVLRKQCEESGNAFAIFTPYPDDYNATRDGECTGAAPCRLQCGAFDCSISAIVKELDDGAHSIQYFVGGGAECRQRLRGLSFGAGTTLDELDPDYAYYRERFAECDVCADDFSCGFVAPVADGFETLFEDDDSSDSEFFEDDDTSNDESEASDSDRGALCQLKDDKLCSRRHEKRIFVPLRAAFRGTGLVVPAHFAIETRLVNVLGPVAQHHCEHECALELPVPVCTEPDSSSSSSSSSDCSDCDASTALHGYVPPPVWTKQPTPAPTPAATDPPAPQVLGGTVIGARAQLAAPSDDYGACETPSADWVAQHTTLADSRVAARAWLNAVDEHSMALLLCDSELFTDTNSRAAVDLPTHDRNSCDYEMCAATLQQSSALVVGGAPRTPAEFIARAAELSSEARNLYSAARYPQARQSACCAERIYSQLLDASECSRQHCQLAHIYPGAGSIEEYKALLDAESIRLRKRAPQEERAYNLARAHEPAQEAAAGAHMLLFEECDEPGELTQPDNDINDAVFGVYASSAVSPRDGAWLSSLIEVEPLARGSLQDHALTFVFDDAGVPPGSRVHVMRYGREPALDCYTVNSLQSETPECPSTNSARLVRSTRAALPAAPGARAPFVNTLASEPLAKAAHRAALFIQVPRATGVRAPSLKLHFALHSRGSNCAASTTPFDGSAERRGLGLLVPAPFYWPLEGVPAYLNRTRVPLDSGLCVNGDNARALCDERDECAGGYCELEGRNAYHCIDADGRPGADYDSSCSHASQCPYGRCYGADPNERGAYPQLAEFLASHAATNMHWHSSRRGPPDSAVYYDPSAQDK